MQDFVILLKAIMVMEFGHTAEEAKRLIGAHPQVVAKAIMNAHSPDGMMRNLRPCAMALEMAEEAIDGHLRKIAESAPTPFKPFPECSNPNPNPNPNPEEHSDDDEWWREMFAAVRANLRAKMVHLDHPPKPPEPPEPPKPPEPPDVWVGIHVRDMCEILVDESTDQDDKHMALMTLAEVLFPNKPIFWDITDASDRPPSLEQVDAVIAAFAAKADIAANQGSSDEPFMALIVAIEWALGRKSTADWVPCYVSSTIKEVIGVEPG